MQYCFQLADCVETDKVFHYIGIYIVSSLFRPLEIPSTRKANSPPLLLWILQCVNNSLFYPKSNGWESTLSTAGNTDRSVTIHAICDRRHYMSLAMFWLIKWFVKFCGLLRLLNAIALSDGLRCNVFKLLPRSTPELDFMHHWDKRINIANTSFYGKFGRLWRWEIPNIRQHLSLKVLQQFTLLALICFVGPLLRFGFFLPP